MRYLRLFPALVVLVAATACASPTAAGKSPASYAPDDLVLQVRTAGGLLPAAAVVTAIPDLSVYGDGRVITTGPVPAIYPGPALPNIQVAHIARADVSALADRALTAGVGNGAELGTPNVADAPTTYFTLRTSSGTVSTAVTALNVEGDGLSAAQSAARRRLQDLADALGDLPKTLGKDAVSEPVPYVPARIAAVATEWQPSAGGLPTDPPPIEWPAASLPGPAVAGRAGVHCLDAEAAPVLTAARGANARTPWLSAGTRWSITFRPLLPGESTCADLTR